MRKGKDSTVTISGIMCDIPFITDTTRGGKKASFVVYDTHRSKYIPCVAEGVEAQKAVLHRAGDIVKICGRIKERSDSNFKELEIEELK